MSIECKKFDDKLLILPANFLEDFAKQFSQVAEVNSNLYGVTLVSVKKIMRERLDDALNTAWREQFPFVSTSKTESEDNQ